MIHLVHIDPRLDRNIGDLRRAGKKGRIAADQAEQVIAAMKRGGPGAARQMPQTHRGELRLDGCIKYDLGGGYRLLTVKEGRERFILFAGTHDDCHRWIENNREMQLGIVRERCRHHRVVTTSASETILGADRDAEAPEGVYAVEPGPELDQRALRLIFAGLCGAD